MAAQLHAKDKLAPFNMVILEYAKKPEATTEDEHVDRQGLTHC
jgi:hypothetical protein